MFELKDVISKVADSKTAKNTEEKVWDLNQRFIQGQQNISYDRNLQSYVNRKEVTNVPVINQLLPLYRTVLSRLAASYPGVVVLPASPSKEDITKAQASEAALRYYWKSEDIACVINKCIEYLLLFGNAGLLSYYDPDADKVCTKPISPFDIFYESGLGNVEDARWVAIRQFYDKDELSEAYPEHKEIIEADTEGKGSPFTQQNNTYSNSVDYIPPGKVEVFEVYLKNGKYGFLLKDEFIFEGEMPNKVWPFQHLKFTDIPNRLWGLSMITPLIEIQSYYNRARGQILQNVELMANPKWLIPKSSGVAPNAITKRSGEKIFFNPAGGKPEQISAAPIPSYVIDNIRQLQSEIMDVAGIHSTTLGKRAVGVISGKAIEKLSANDVSALQTTQDSIERGCGAMAKAVLSLMKEYYKKPKMYRMLDNLGRVIFHEVHDTNIVNDPEIHIEAGSLFHDKAQDRETRIMAMFEAGLLEKEEALKELTYRTGNAFIIEQLEGRAHARDMLDAVRAGAAIEVFSTDNLKSFAEVFNEFSKTRDFYDLDEERQDYVRDILIAVSAPPGPEGDEVAEAARKNMKVFPRSSAKSLDQAKLQSVQQQSPVAAVQTAAGAVDQMGEQGLLNKMEMAESRQADTSVNEAIKQRGAAR